MTRIPATTMTLAALALAGCVTPPAQPADACGAQARAGLVGAPLPPRFTPPDPARIFTTGDALTMDFVEHRLNVELDPQTGDVVRVFCG